MKEIAVVALSLILGFSGGYVVGKACENVVMGSCNSDTLVSHIPVKQYATAPKDKSPH